MLALIAMIAVQLGVDARLSQELALGENHKLSCTVIGVTGDLGLFQLNPEYLDYFILTYWTGNEKEVVKVLGKFEKFNWKNPRHNAFVGICILRDHLKEDRFNVWQALIAYNCGSEPVLAGKPPVRSIEHANRIFTRWRDAKGAVLR